MLLALLGFAYADTWYLETAAVPERPAAVRMQEVAAKAGHKARVVKRFQLGEGWGFVVLVEGFGTEAAATKAQARLATDLGGPLVLFRIEEGGKAGIAVPPAAPAADAPTAGEWIARADAAHGGASGGTSALARAEAVHFVFEREFEVEGRKMTVSHDYWREGASRRLAVDTRGGGTDSLAIANGSGGWVVVGGQAEARDLGVLIGAVDAFAPESVLTAALDVHALLTAPEIADFRLLEGADRVVRVGAGADEPQASLSFVDIDPETGRLAGLRWVSPAGPIRFELSDYRALGAGLAVPHRVTIERADGRTEQIAVRTLEVADRAPAGTFDRPGS